MTKESVTVTKRQVEIGSTGTHTNIFFLLDDSYIIWSDKDVESHPRWRWARLTRSQERVGFQTHGAKGAFEDAVVAAVENNACWKEIESE
jgi:hypothetical protein